MLSFSRPHPGRYRILRRWAALWGSLSLSLLLGGCATPQYATETRYVPPAGEAGLECLRGCHLDMMACQADCSSRRQACVRQIEPDVDAAFEAALRRYEIERRHYMRERQFYQLDRAMRIGLYRDPFYFGFPGAIWYPDHYYNDPPVPPAAPDRAAIRAELIDRQCNQPCGCQAAFDACYIGCGGQLEKRTVCIKHCGPNDPLPARLDSSGGS